MLLSFDGVSAPVLLEGCDDLEPLFAPLLNGWRYREVSQSAVPPVITASGNDKDGYVLNSSSLSKEPDKYKPEEYATRCRIVNGILADLILAYAQSTQMIFCLHCAGVMIGGKLVIFPATGRTGKSTLSTRLAAGGARFFSDDVVPMNARGDAIISLGIAPRLRLPLAKNADKVFLDYVKARGNLKDNRYQYVPPAEDNWAPLGEEASVAAIVLLEREGVKNKRPEITPASKSQTLQRMVKQNFGASVDISQRFSRLHDLTVSSQCYVLKYKDPGSGADALFRYFGDE